MHSLRFPKTKDQKDQKHPPHFWLAKLAFWTSLPCWCLASRGSLRQESASRAESSHAGTLFEDTRLRFEQDYTGILPICISFSHLAQCVPKAEMLIGLDLQQQKIIQRSPASLRTPIFVSQPRHKARSRVAIPACAAKAFASCTSSAQSSASMFSYHVSGRWSLEASGMLARKLLYARCTSKASRALLSHPMQGCVCVCVLRLPCIFLPHESDLPTFHQEEPEPFPRNKFSPPTHPENPGQRKLRFHPPFDHPIAELLIPSTPRAPLILGRSPRPQREREREREREIERERERNREREREREREGER